MATASWTARALPREVRPLRDAVAAFLAASGVDGEPLQDIRLALSEAVSNVVRHAYAGAEAGPLTVDVEATADEVLVVVRDRGSGLRPRPDSPGAGLGLPLMATLASGFDVCDRDEGGIEVRLSFARPGRAGARAA